MSDRIGVFMDLPETVYRADPALCQSDLKIIERSPRHFLAKTSYEVEREDTDSLTMGKIAGTLALEPDRKAWWTVKPDGLKLNTKEGMAWKKEHEGEYIVDYSLFQRASSMATSVLDHPIASEILRNAKREVSVFGWVSTEFGDIRRKARLDILTEGNVITDLKSTRDARPDPFMHSIERFGYDVQAAWYLDTWNAASKDQKEIYLLIAVENIAPYCVWVHRLSKEYIAQGRAKYLGLLNKYAECATKNEWPGYPVEITTLNPNE